GRSVCSAQTSEWRASAKRRSSVGVAFDRSLARFRAAELSPLRARRSTARTAREFGLPHVISGSPFATRPGVRHVTGYYRVRRPLLPRPAHLSWPVCLTWMYGRDRRSGGAGAAADLSRLRGRGGEDVCHARRGAPSCRAWR